MSSDPKNYSGFTFDEFTELDCRALSLISQILSDVMVYTSSVNSSNDIDKETFNTLEA